MLVKTKAIVLSALKFQENSLIVKCFTQSDGMKSYFVRSAYGSKSPKVGGAKIAYFQPMTLLEIEAVHKNKGTLEHFKEIKIYQPYQTIPTDVVKSTLLLFLAEMLQHAIHEEEKNCDFFDFIEAALLWLDSHQESANFHLVFLIEAAKYLGFYPDTSAVELPYFNLSEGQFTDSLSFSTLGEHETALFKRVLDLKFDTDQKAFHVSERQMLLKIIIDYYTLHLSGFKKPKSLEVLKAFYQN
jgi:DNA repair protein RecO (recombination protein O)